jgi:hypothetical protein
MFGFKFGPSVFEKNPMTLLPLLEASAKLSEITTRRFIVRMKGGARGAETSLKRSQNAVPQISILG